MVGIWVYHILAGLLGLVLSVSIFYQQLEKRWSVYRKLDEGDVVKVVGEAGDEFTDPERAAFVERFNQLAYIGRSAIENLAPESGVTVHLRSGEVLRVVQGPKFYEVERIKPNRKRVYFRLFDRAEKNAH